MKTPYVLALASILLMACSTTEKPIAEDTVEEVAVPDELIMAPFAFNLPEDWSAETQMNAVYISVPDATYDVQLVMTLETSESELTEGMEVISTEEGIQIYSVGFGGAYYAGNLAYEGQAYSYGFQVESTEPAPENLDGTWFPSTEVTQADLADFIATVHLAN